jgi:tetratricopeptide (TPR) repeat protein
MESNQKMTRNDTANKMRYSKIFPIAAFGLAAALFAAVSCGDALAQAENLNSVANEVKEDSTTKILQTAGEAPVASQRGVELSRTRQRDGSSKNGLADEFEDLPNLNVRADSDSLGHEPHGAKFMEVLPGVTKFSELDRNPMLQSPVAVEQVGGFDVATYQTATLPDTTIQIIAANDIVEAIMINLPEPRSETDARKVFESELKDVRPIWAPDEVGNFREVFPEKGIAFVLEKGEKPGLPSNRVIQIVAETVKSEYFIMRAEQDLLSNLTHARDDAEHALLHDANLPGANWILAQTHLAVGDITNARKYIYKAIKLNDSTPQFHLTYIDALIQAGEAESALRYMDAVRDSFVEHPLFAIEAVCLDSILRREAGKVDYDGSISQGQRALKLLQSLYDARATGDVYLAAKTLELRANLSIALAVAQKRWKNETDQEKTFEWLDAASAVAKEIDAARPEDSQLPTAQIDVLTTAIDVCLEIPDSDRFDNYVQKLTVSAELYLRKSLDEVSAAAVRWKTGRALVAASRIYDARKDAKQAASCASKGLEYISVVTEYRPIAERVPAALAQLQLGVILAGQGKIDEAFDNFDQARELIAQVADGLKSRDASRVGAPLVSVATLFWKNDQREQGVEALMDAVELLERGREAGYTKDANLYVAYSNLSTMCRGLKRTAEATRYQKLAEQYAPEK